MFTECAINSNIRNLYISPDDVCECFLWTSEKITIIYLNSNNEEVVCLPAMNGLDLYMQYNVNDVRLRKVSVMISLNIFVIFNFEKLWFS
jgi:hypothetical protein